MNNNSCSANALAEHIPRKAVFSLYVLFTAPTTTVKCAYSQHKWIGKQFNTSKQNTSS